MAKDVIDYYETVQIKKQPVALVTPLRPADVTGTEFAKLAAIG